MIFIGPQPMSNVSVTCSEILKKEYQKMIDNVA